MSRWITVGIVVGTVTLLIVWDLVVAFNSTPGDTESEVVRDFAFRHPMTAVSLSTLVTHFFVPMPVSKTVKKILTGCLITVGVVGLALDLLGWLPVPAPFGFQFLGLIPYVVGGLGIGLLWPQQPSKGFE